MTHKLLFLHFVITSNGVLNGRGMMGQHIKQPAAVSSIHPLSLILNMLNAGNIPWTNCWASLSQAITCHKCSSSAGSGLVLSLFLLYGTLMVFAIMKQLILISWTCSLETIYSNWCILYSGLMMWPHKQWKSNWFKTGLWIAPVLELVQWKRVSHFRAGMSKLLHKRLCGCRFLL